MYATLTESLIERDSKIENVPDQKQNDQNTLKSCEILAHKKGAKISCHRDNKNITSNLKKSDLSILSNGISVIITLFISLSTCLSLKGQTANYNLPQFYNTGMVKYLKNNEHLEDDKIDLALTLNVDKHSVKINEEIEFTITVYNKSNVIATDVAVTKWLPKEFCANFKDISDAGAIEQERIVWSDLKVGASESISLSYKAIVVKEPTKKVFYSYAEISKAAQSDVNSTPNNFNDRPSENDEDLTSVKVVEYFSDLKIMMDADQAEVLSGDVIKHYVTLLNQGPHDAKEIILVNTLPNEYVECSKISDHGVYEESEVQWAVHEMKSGSSVTFTFEAVIVSEDTMTDECRSTAKIISSSSSDPDVSNNKDETTVKVKSGPSVLSLDVQVFLEGAFNNDTELMSNKLNRLGYLPGQSPKTFLGKPTPAGQPYKSSPWNYQGEEGSNFSETSSTIQHGTKYEESVVDWVLVSLRIDPSTKINDYQKAALLHTDGSIEILPGFEFRNVDLNEEYYIVIEHRNHLSIMSPFPLPIVNGTLKYDFRNNDSYKRFLGAGQKEIKPGIFAMVAANGDQSSNNEDAADINPNDLTKWVKDNGLSSRYLNSDFNLSGDVNVRDKGLFLKNNGLFSDVQCCN